MHIKTVEKFKEWLRSTAGEERSVYRSSPNYMKPEEIKLGSHIVFGKDEYGFNMMVSTNGAHLFLDDTGICEKPYNDYRIFTTLEEAQEWYSPKPKNFIVGKFYRWEAADDNTKVECILADPKKDQGVFDKGDDSYQIIHVNYLREGHFVEVD